MGCERPVSAFSRPEADIRVCPQSGHGKNAGGHANGGADSSFAFWTTTVHQFRARDRIIEQPLPMLVVTTELIGPEHNHSVELAIFGLVHGGTRY